MGLSQYNNKEIAMNWYQVRMDGRAVAHLIAPNSSQAMITFRELKIDDLALGMYFDYADFKIILKGGEWKEEQGNEYGDG